MLKETSGLTPADRVILARQATRPKATQYIDALFTDFYELHGDRLTGDDKSILGGIGFFKSIAVTVIAQCKGTNLDENIKYNFGMSVPAGYRKVLRLAKNAEKFNRPIITFIDTPGAYPGIEAEEKGQGEAIAQCLALFSSLTVPTIAVIIGEGGSGGALAIALANTVIMLENSVYSILSPEGFASILWKDSTRSAEAAAVMQLTAFDLLNNNIIDFVINEGEGGINENKALVFKDLDELLFSELTRLLKLSPAAIKDERYKKFRNMGNFYEG
ncbi:MAG: acetyl-CoA carboxylase carboxyltransferase subunit alpha [Oscillospiraceae bacterium]